VDGARWAGTVFERKTMEDERERKQGLGSSLTRKRSKGRERWLVDRDRDDVALIVFGFDSVDAG
jgi:hypothetical protein